MPLVAELGNNWRTWFYNVDRERIAPSPPTQTGRAVLPHPAFQFVVADGLAQAFDSRHRKSRTSRAGLRPAHLFHRRSTVSSLSKPQARFSHASGRSALRHYPDPFEMKFLRRPTPRPCPPSLHGRYPLPRYYEGSDPDRPLRRRPWFPDSRHLNFQPFHLQSSAVLPQTRSTASTPGALFGLRLSLAGSSETADRIEFTLSGNPDLVTDWLFISSCSPPGGIAPAQLLSITGLSVSARSGTYTLLFRSALRRTRGHSYGVG